LALANCVQDLAGEFLRHVGLGHFILLGLAC
jgi:hypothetical protein